MLVKSCSDILVQLTISIRNDLKMTQADVANSNIVALLATYVLILDSHA